MSIEHPLLRKLQMSLLAPDGYSGPTAREVLSGFSAPIDRDDLAPLYHDGSHSLLSTCARTGDIDLVRMALEKGLDANELEFRGSGSRTGPLTAAVDSGSAEVVEALIAAGSNVDLDRPLVAALTCGDRTAMLAMVGVLLEGGVKPNRLHSRFGNMDQAFTALDFAQERASPQEIIDLLRSYGAKTKDELAAEGAELPREAADSAVAKHFEAKRGEPAAMLGVSDDIRCFVLRPAEGQRGITTLFTDGLARTFLRGERFELYLELEAGFDVDDAGGWPVEWLQRLAELPQQGEHFELPVTTVATSRLLRPFQKGTPYAGWMLFGDEDLAHPAYAHPVRLLRATPLTKPEIKLERKEGTPALMRALDAAGVPRTVARTRDSAV